MNEWKILNFLKIQEKTHFCQIIKGSMTSEFQKHRGNVSRVQRQSPCPRQRPSPVSSGEDVSANTWKRSGGLGWIPPLLLHLLFGCAGSSWLRGLFSSCGEPGLLSSYGVQASHCPGFFCWGARALGCVGFSSCSSQVQLLQGIWDPPGSGIKPVSPALAGGFFTTEPSGKPWTLVLVTVEKHSLLALMGSP